MKRPSRLLILLAGALALSCTEAPPTAPPPAQLRADWLFPRLLGLLTCSPLPADSVTQVIGPDGGTLNVGPHSLVVPPGALDSAVSITAVIPADSTNRVMFFPQGLTFQGRATLTMSYANCGLVQSLLPRQIAYTNDLLQILYILPSFDNWSAKTVTTGLHHFSDYAVAW
jgi:hypothetical protein